MNTMSNTRKEISSRLGIAAKATFGIWGDAPDKYRAAIDYIQAQRTPSSAAMSDLKKAIKRRRSEAAQAKNPQTKEMLEDDAGGLENVLDYAQRGDHGTLLRSAYNLDTEVRDDIPIEMFIWAGADVNWSHRNAKSLLDTVSALVARSKHGKSEMAFDSKYNVGDRVVARVSAQGMKKGQVYTVTDIEQQVTPWGTFVDYKLDNKMWVGNGHLVLDKATNAKPGKKSVMEQPVQAYANLISEFNALDKRIGRLMDRAKEMSVKSDRILSLFPKDERNPDPAAIAKSRQAMNALREEINAMLGVFKFSRPGAKAAMAANDVPLNKPFTVRGKKVIVRKAYPDGYEIFPTSGAYSLGKTNVLNLEAVIQAMEAQNRKAASHLLSLLNARPGAKAVMGGMRDTKGRGPFQLRYIASGLYGEPTWLLVDKAGKTVAKEHNEQSAQEMLRKANAGEPVYVSSRPGAKATAAKPDDKTECADCETEQDKAGLKLMEKADKAVSDKIRTLIKEGKPQDQAVAIALDMKRRGEL